MANGEPRGVRPEWLASDNFVMVHFDLIDMGLSLEAALLLQRIDYRSGYDGWWYVTKAEMQADTRLSERKLDRAIGELREHGMVAWERQSAQNPTLRWRIVRAEDPEPRNRPSREGQNVPQERDETSLSSYKNEENKTPSSPAGDGEALSTEDELFDDFWRYYPRKVAKKDARTAFAKALKATDYPTVRAGLVAAIKSWRADGKVVVVGSGEDLKVAAKPGDEGKGVPHAATWLNAERWNDEHPVAEQAGGNGEEGNGWMSRRSG